MAQEMVIQGRSITADEIARIQGLLAQHHYLGYRNTVGENLRYPLVANFRRELCA